MKNTFDICSKQGCTNNAEVGGHIINADKNASNVWYIIPICKMCNSIDTETDYVLKKDVVPVQVTDTKNC